MNRVLLNGVGGQMGHALLAAIRDDPTFTVVGGVDPFAAEAYPFPVFASADAIDVEADVVIDFSTPQATEAILAYCTARKLPLVIGTTALGEDVLSRIEAASKTIPVFRSGNMSLGINLMRKLLQQTRKTLGDAFDIEIIEAHHNRKKDAPSGTALMLAEAIEQADDAPHDYVYGRSEKDRRREKGEIGFHSIRGGTVVGEHEVRFLGTDEELSILHRASSKRVFASGALRAAAFLLKQAPGLYNMDDLLEEVLER